MRDIILIGFVRKGGPCRDAEKKGETRFRTIDDPGLTSQVYARNFDPMRGA